VITLEDVVNGEQTNLFSVSKGNFGEWVRSCL